MSRKRTSVVWDLSKEEFEEVVKKSNSIAEILRFCGLENKGCNYRTVKTRIKNENIDISHIKLGSKHNLGRKFKSTKIALELVLVENSTYSRTHLKQRLINNSIIEYKCRDCGIEDEWNNKKIVLHLEHINGISNDNRIENLCFLCPNCHSQTETYAGKNKNTGKIIRKCSCGKILTHQSTRCNKCRGNDRRKIPEKECLEQDFKLLKVSQMARKYKVSHTSIRRWLKHYGIL